MAVPNPPSGTLPILGWREWVRLPDFDVPRIKAKVDTGARSSALHVTDMRELPSGEMEFTIHPHQRSGEDAARIRAPLLERRSVRSSSGESRIRPVVRLVLAMGTAQWSTEMTLARRDQMGFRMLLGRTAIRRRFLVDPSRSFVQSGRETGLDGARGGSADDTATQPPP